MTLTPRLDRLERNQMVNGNFDYWQRGTSFTPTTRTYGADRWIMFTNAGAYASSITRQASGLSGSQYCARIQRPNGQANTSDVYLAQVTETMATVVSGVAGKHVYLRFMARKSSGYSGAGISSSLASGTGTNEQGPGNAAFTGQSTVIPATVSALTTSWQEFKFEGDVPLGCTQLRLEFSTSGMTGTAGTTEYIEIAQVSLTMAALTDFVYARRDVFDELTLCQRYFLKTYDIDAAPGSGATFAGGISVAHYYANDQGGHFTFPVVMRAVPSIGLYAPVSGASGYARNTNGGAQYAVGNYGASTRGLLISVNNPADVDDGMFVTHVTADAEI